MWSYRLLRLDRLRGPLMRYFAARTRLTKYLPIGK
jgi:hypothetical protein